MGSLNVACQNPSNAAILTGHASGAASMWIPTEKNPVVKILCHNSGVRSLSVHRSGLYLASCGLDRSLKIWDLRSTYNCLATITLPTPAISLNYSQMGLLALGSSTTVQILKDPSNAGEFDEVQHVDVEAGTVHRRVLKSAYLTHNCARPVHCVQFCPYEDVLGVGTAGGFHSLLCPGSAEPNYDALEENPFASKRYRQEREVKRLLDKIPYTMISVDSIVNKVRREDIVEEWEKKRNALLGEIPKVPMPSVKRNKKKGRSKATKVEKRKQLVRFNRKQFEVSNMLRKKVARKEKAKKVEGGALPSDALVSKKRTKKRTMSALDILIPKKH
uniref:WD_REPEATS_REGION domain-containing protein n=1 Tax=Mesocestoides corti TaxID=53468 RepID=A0A5K3F1Y6_MESCO